jgi:hypothetical protein
LQLGVQTPETHAVEPFALVQATPHAPQWLVLLLSEASQPLAVLLSQLPQPVLQDTSVHVPVEHDSEALAKSHTTPQPLQFDSVLSEVSQPFAGCPSQLANPLVQVPRVQTPVAQDSAALGKSQSTPQPPQFDRVLSEASQPLAALLSQLP